MLDSTRLTACIALILLAISTAAYTEGKMPTDPNQHLERTCFQEAGPYNDRIDLKSDVVLVYGIDKGLPGRLGTWHDQGYITHVMTGVAWGGYEDYISDRKWDGKSHEDEIQTDKDGKQILHGHRIPYVSPGPDYGRYLFDGVKRAIDAGAEGVHLEEPEFWVRGGYEEGFKREWREYYGDEWQPLHSSPDAQYRASKLKYFLYRRALRQVFDSVRDYSKKIGRDVKCYVPTHSMINYAWWGIVSPESSLVQLPGCDGYIGQVWTGTARTPNVYQGVLKERTFESAFCEYGVLSNLVRSTGRRMWYLNDPIEDSPEHSWADYRRNWESTLVASLLWPDMWRFEVAPWPGRVFTGQYPKKDITERVPGEEVEKESIPPDYATELLTVFNSMNDLNQPDVKWDCGTQGIGILVSDTMMFQRGEPNPSDSHFGSFFGFALPLIKRGVPVHPVQLENIDIKGYLAPYKVLFLTYEGMKPPRPELHDALTAWVKAGGVLVCVDDDKDPYNAVKDWWNSDGRSYKTPRAHLFEKLGFVGTAKPGAHRLGKGALVFSAVSPASLTRNKAGAAKTLELAKEGAKLAGLDWRETNYLMLRRGPYVVAAGIDESPWNKVLNIKGRLINLLDADLSVSDTVDVTAGQRVFLLDIEGFSRKKAAVLASASKVLDVKVNEKSIKFNSEGPSEVLCATRLLVPKEPKFVSVSGYEPSQVTEEYDKRSRTLLLKYPNSPNGVDVRVEW